MKAENYGIAKKGTYRVQREGQNVTCLTGKGALAAIAEFRALAEAALPHDLTPTKIAPGTVLSVHVSGSLRTAKGRPAELTVAIVICDLDLDTDPEERRRWETYGHLEGEKYVRRYDSENGRCSRSILCKTVTYTITRES